jgi:hypothetical protein
MSRPAHISLQTWMIINTSGVDSISEHLTNIVVNKVILGHDQWVVGFPLTYIILCYHHKGIPEWYLLLVKYIGYNLKFLRKRYNDNFLQCIYILDDDHFIHDDIRQMLRNWIYTTCNIGQSFFHLSLRTTKSICPTSVFTSTGQSDKR